MIDPTTLQRGDRFVLAAPGIPEFDGLAVTFSSVVGNTNGSEVCVCADLMDIAERGNLDEQCDSGGGLVVPTRWLVKP